MDRSAKLRLTFFRKFPNGNGCTTWELKWSDGRDDKFVANDRIKRLWRRCSGQSLRVRVRDEDAVFLDLPAGTSKRTREQFVAAIVDEIND